MISQAHCLVAQKSFTRPKPAKELAFLTRGEEEKHETLTQYILQGGVRWYAICGFSHRSSVSFGQERSPKSAPTTCTNRCTEF